MAHRHLSLVCLVASCLHLATAGVALETSQPSGATDLQAECQRAMAACRPGQTCNLPHPTTCHKYIVCSQTGIASQFRPISMPCAFGTVWHSAPGLAPGCHNAELVDCTTDPCKKQGTTSFAHDGPNCRTYWTCSNGRSKPQCCRKYMRFDPTQGTCVVDPTCNDLCPLINDATCRGPGVESIALPDGNCRTYYQCKGGKPNPVCCQDGYGYDVITSTCVANAACTDVCPDDYKGNKSMCAQGDTSSYKMSGANCRTYMKCNPQGGQDRYCCASGQMFDTNLKTCVVTDVPACLQQGCPWGFKDACRLEAVADPTKFKNVDAFGGTIMPCPVGTVFNKADCNCQADPALLERLRLQPPGCRPAIHVQMPSLENQGAAFAALMRLGSYGQGESGVGNMTAFWGGDDGINIPHFGEQSLTNVYLQITFKPAVATSTKQVLLSSCSYIGGALDSPTLELALLQAAAQGGILKTKIRSSLKNSIELDLQYQADTWYMFRLAYDGRRVGIVLQALTPGTQPTTTPADVNIGEFTGPIQIYRSGLRFAKCRYEQGPTGFVGDVAEIIVSKCLSPEMRSILQPAAGAAPAV